MKKGDLAMENEKFKFRVIGNVLLFGQVVGKVDDVTWAPTKARAKSNLLYRYKRSHGMLADSKLTFSGVAEHIY